MQVTNKIEIHLDDKRRVPPIDAVQGDSCTRVMEFSLYSGGQKWDVPEGADVWVGYCGDGGKGMYSKLSEAEDAEPAYSVSGNVVTVTLIPQVTAVAGYTELNVMFRNEDTGQQIATFSVTIRVARNPATGAGKPEDYYDIRQWVSAGPLVVTVTKNSDGTYSADKTHLAIITAVSANREVICRRSSLVMTAQRVSNNIARFIADDEGVQYVLEIDSNNVITFTENACAYLSDLDDYAKTEDLVEYAKASDVRNPLYVVFTVVNGVCTADKSFDDIKSAYAEKRTIIGVKAPMVMRLQYLTEKTIRFQSTNEYRYDYVEMIKTTNSDGEIVTAIDYRTDYYAQGTASADEKYFDIDCDGVISLKLEYKANGSKATSLPERITIPDNIGGEQVSGFQVGMFKDHQRIKSVVLPPSATKISNEMFHKAIYLEKVENTEQIQEIGENAFSWTRIRDIRFPNLISAGVSAFENCSCMTTIDVGKITSIADRSFAYCENLSEVLGGSNVTTIGQEAFYATRRLKSLPFLANLTSIGDKAFYSSRCDFEEVYELLLSRNAFGTLSTYKQYEGEDYWSGVPFTPCKTPLRSLFHQKNPLWADTVITPDILDDDVPSTYGKTGCAFISLAEIYSAFEGKDFASPVEFAEILESKGLLGTYNFRYRDGWCAIADALGYETEFINAMSKTNLQKVYNALAAGALVYKSTAATDQDGGHATLWYGVNSDGEFLVSDTSMHCNEVGIYENHKSAWHTYKNGSQNCDTVIVWKGGKTW